VKTDEPQTNQPQPKQQEHEQSDEEFLGNVTTLYEAWEKGGRAALQKALEDLEKNQLSVH
jgi:hypothetical protein